jgi:hypothetical protein
MSRDARLFLEKGIRHSIIQAAAYQPALPAVAEDQASMSGMSRDSR